MASLIRFTVRNFGNNVSKSLFNQHELNFVRTITSKMLRVESPEKSSKPKPWPYREKKYTVFHQLFDRTTSRFDENSKVIIVEGPIAAGKSKFAKQLAEDLDMLYFPEANLDMIYINKYGFDYRSLDIQMPENCRTFDIPDFLLNPRHLQVAAFQLNQYIVKFSQYIDALAHVLSTGEGVILDRSCFSDYVFVEAMYSQGYISKGVYDMYYKVRKYTVDELLKPHLIIYLDVTIPKILENVQKRRLPYEVKSPVLTKEYLTVMEKHYKQNYLKEMSKHSELLIYDWSDGGDPEVVVEDIERISFEVEDNQKMKFDDWDNYNEEDWAELRMKFCNEKHILMQKSALDMVEVPELMIDAENAEIMNNIFYNAPGNRYDYGYNSDMGDKGVLFKSKQLYRDTLPLTERRAYK